AAALDLGDVQPADPDLIERVLDRLQALVADDCLDLVHGGSGHLHVLVSSASRPEVMRSPPGRGMGLIPVSPPLPARSGPGAVPGGRPGAPGGGTRIPARA